MQKKRKKSRAAANQNPRPRRLFLNANVSKFTPCGDDFAMFIPRGHGFSDVVACGFYLRVRLRGQNRDLVVPRGEKPPTDATISLDDDGISAPVQKIPPRSTSEPPPPPSDDTSLPIDPPNALSTWRKPEGARKDTKKSSNRPDVKILFDPPTETNQRPSPPSSAPCASTRDNNITKRRRLANRGAGAPGGSRR